MTPEHERLVRELLGPMGPAEAELLSRHLVDRRYPPGFAVFHEGLAPRDLLLLVEGRLRLSKLRPDKRQERIAMVEPVALLGIAAAVGGFPYPTTAMALEPSTCLAIPAALLRPGAEPVACSLALQLTRACLRGMNAQLRAANARLLGLAGERELVASLSLDLGAWSLPERA